MAIREADRRILFQRSGNQCAFPSCTNSLVYADIALEGLTVVSEIAHIVAQKPDGPRGNHHLPLEERDRYDNLILLCNLHHKVVDSHPESYTVERLRQMKTEHESLIKEATEKAVASRHVEREGAPYITETLHSTLLPVATMPDYIYGVPCELSEAEVKRLVKSSGREVTPFILRSGMLWCFQNLRHPRGPFSELATAGSVERCGVTEWCEDPDLERMLIDLLNRALNKLTGRKGLNFDRAHKRYYFQPEHPGEVLEVAYRPLNQESATRKVVWSPVTKKTGLNKNYWLHRAVSLRFRRVAEAQWYLSIRPGFHVTADSTAPYPSEKVGSRITKKMSRMFNYDLLGEVHFWRDFLSGSTPYIALSFGQQRIQIATTLMQAPVEWPGMPEEHAKPFKNVIYEEDLFSLLELEAEDGSFDEEAEDWEEF